MSPRFLLPIISFASGVCGIAYELLYARALSLYLGDMFYVAASILAVFLAGLGVGALYAHKRAGDLWAIELGIGIYAVGASLILSHADRFLLETLPAFASGNPSGIAALVILLLSPVAIAVGFAVPLLTAYWSASTKKRHGFIAVYAIYNLGAFFCVNAVEFWLLRSLGMSASLLVLASVNFANAALLWHLKRDATQKEALAQPALSRTLPSAIRLPLLIVGIASVASGLCQLLLLQIARTVFGPYHESFSLLVACSLLGISGGTLIAKRIGFSNLLILGGAAVGVGFSLLGPAMMAWASVNNATEVSASFGLARWIGFILLFGGPSLVFGATVPALVRELPDGPRFAGLTLAVSSFGNATGYLLALLVLHGALQDKVTAALIAAMLVSGGFVLAAGSATRVALLGICMVCALAPVVFFPTNMLRLAHIDFRSPEALEKALESVGRGTTIRRFGSEVSIHVTEDGTRSLVIDGYHSLSLPPGEVQRLELIFGLTPVLYPDKRERALVLGLGTGITAAATAFMFEHTTVAEVSPAVLSALPYFAADNYSLHLRENVDIMEDDGLAVLAGGKEKWDVIVNTVTTPLFFSSSKLYTVDFLTLVLDHLAEGGVYATWFDGRIGDAGARILYHTLTSVFADCHIGYLSPKYSQVICGAQKLTPAMIPDADWAPELLAALETDRVGLPLSALLDALLFPVHSASTIGRDAPLNTFDLTALEFVISGRVPALEIRGTEIVQPDIYRSALHPERLSQDQFIQRCYAARIANGAGINACRRAMLSENGILPLGYTEPVLHFLRGSSRHEEQLDLVPHLSAAGEVAAALSYVEEMEPSGTGGDRLEMLRIALRLAILEPYPHFVLRTLLDLPATATEERRRLALEAAQKMQHRVAIWHLETLKHLGTANEVDLQELQNLKRVVAEIEKKREAGELPSDRMERR